MAQISKLGLERRGSGQGLSSSFTGGVRPLLADLLLDLSSASPTNGGLSPNVRQQPLGSPKSRVSEMHPSGSGGMTEGGEYQGGE